MVHPGFQASPSFLAPLRRSGYLRLTSIGRYPKTSGITSSACRKGRSDTYCYGFEDDGPHANTVLGAVWMMHKDMMSYRND